MGCTDVDDVDAGRVGQRLVGAISCSGAEFIGEGLRDHALSVTPLISLGALFSGLNSYYFLQAFTLAKKTRLLVVAMTIPALSNIALNVVLIPLMGLQGAALASCISFALGLLGSWALGLKTLPLPVPMADLIKTALCVGVMMGVLAVMPGSTATPGGALIELATRAVTGMIVYAGLAYALDLNGVRPHAERIAQRLYAKVVA